MPMVDQVHEHDAIHEAAHTVVACIYSLPFTHCSVGKVEGTNHNGQFCWDAEAIVDALRAATPEERGRLLCQVAMLRWAGHFADLHIGNLSQEQAEKHSGGDEGAFHVLCDYVQIPQEYRELVLEKARHEMEKLAQDLWFRDRALKIKAALMHTGWIDRESAMKIVGPTKGK